MNNEEFLQKIAESIKEAVRTPPVADIFDSLAKLVKATESGIESYSKYFAPTKTTFDTTINKVVDSALPVGLGLATAGVIANVADRGISAAATGISGFFESLSEDDKINKLIEIQPSLNQYSRDLVKDYYKQLQHFAPDIAKNSLAAASYIKNALAMHDQGLPLASFELLTKTQKNITDMRPSAHRGPLANILTSGTKSMGEKGSLDFAPFFPKD